MSFAPGTRFGAYEVVEMLGAGGMGEVYRATDTKLKRQVALKILPLSLAADSDRLARFQREAEVLASLNHPHIAAIYGLEATDGVQAIVMELVEGEDLAQRIARGRIPLDEALPIAKQIAEALEAAHERGIIHRDLKPANIKVRADGAVKVLDFGLAKAMEPSGSMLASGPRCPTITTPAMTEAGMILGTAAYMSPEQARGQVVDKRTDIWGFGCLLFEMLTGTRPFGESTITDTLARVLEREPEWTALPAAMPPSLRILLQRCLRKDPEKRLHDIADARIEIDEGEPSAASSEPTAGDRAARARLRRLTWTAAILGLIAVVSLAMVAVLLLNPAPPATALSMDSVALTIMPPSGSTFGNRMVRFAVSPDGRQIVFAALVGTRSSLWVRPIAAEEYREIAGTDGAVFPFWKPDSKEIGFFAGGKLKRVALAGGPVDVCDVPMGVAFEGGATWNREDIILFMSRHFTLHRVSAIGGPPTPVTTLAEGETAHRWPWFLPDGQHFLYLVSRQQGLSSQVHVGSFDGRSMLVGAAESNALYADGHLLFLRSGQLVAQRFDLSTRRLTGAPVPVTPLMQTIATGGLGLMSVSEQGVLATSQGVFSRNQRLTWRARSGNAIGTVGQSGIFTNLELNRDDSRIAVAAVMASRTNFDIWVVDVARGTSEPVTSDPELEFDPSWSPDEKRIGFISSRVPGRFTAFSRSADASGRDETLIVSDSSVSLNFWSRLGVGYGERNHLWIRPLNGAPRPAIASTEGGETSGALSPDEHSIAFVSAKSGRPEVYIRAFPSGDREVRVSQDGGRAPRWRADSKEMFLPGA